MKALIHENVPLAPMTTFRIGGPARYFTNVPSEEALQDALAFADARQLPVFILGGGSNLLVADSGFPGLVIKIDIAGLEWEPAGGRTLLRAGAGEEWDGIVAGAVARNLAGMECLSGIPGSAGGTPVQNVGAYGQEVSEVIVDVRVLDRRTNSISTLNAEACGFAYRTSIFNSREKDRYVVVRVTYSLANDGAPSLRYADVLREFEGAAAPPSLADVRDAVRRIRARKAMLIVEGDPDCRSAGSFFKNPVVTDSEFRELESRFTSALPRYPAASGKVKTAAAWLIEQAGFAKGFSLGPAGLSTKHTLAIVNKGGARAADILQLARTIQGRVREKFGIELHPEPVLIGFS